MNARSHQTVLILSGKDVRVDIQHKCAVDVLNESDFCTQIGTIENYAAEEFGALWVPGGVEIRYFLNITSMAGDRVVPDVRDTIRFFCNSRRPIVAPCMALPAVLESIKGSVEMSAINKAEAIGDLVVYPLINVITTARPILGKPYSEIRRVFEEILGLLARKKNY